MAKGRKNELRTDKKPENTSEQKVTSEATKENKPAAKKDCARKTPSIVQRLLSPGKPRSPLCDSSSMLIQEGSENVATNVEMSKMKKDIPNETTSENSESKEQKAESACRTHGIKEQATGAVAAADKQVSASKTRNRTGRKIKAKKTENKAPQNRKVTDFFPVRRSNRKTKGELKNEEHKHIDDLIKNGTEEGMQVRTIEGKGRGVFAVNGFKKGEFVVEYHGDLMDLAEAKDREASYAKDPQTGCYMYYFQYQSKTYCVDATRETDRLGRLINHSKTGNCQTKLHAIDETPHLILVASKDIKADEELLYDYGDRSKDSISAHPWLKY